MYMGGEDRVTFPSLGIDTYNDLGLWLVDFDDEVPETKTYTVDIPAGNGVLDLTEAILGQDVVYGQGVHTIELVFPESVGFHQLKTRIKNLLHGRRLDYKMSWEPEYTYTGRVAVSFEENFTSEYGTVTLEIEHDPFKLKEVVTRYYEISNGLIAHIESGRKKVQPTFEFSNDTIVVFNDERYVMPAGSYKLEDVWLTGGTNEVFFMPADSRSYMTHGEMAEYTWRHLRTERLIFELYRGDMKFYVKRIEVAGAATAVTGVLTFTATDEEGVEHSATLDIGSLQVVEGDSIVIEGGVAKVTVYNGKDFPDTYAFEFPEIASKSAIESVSTTCPGAVTYDIGSTAFTKDYQPAEHADHADKTHAVMTAYRHSQLGIVEVGDKAVSDIGGESVYVQYEWREL